MSWHDGRQVRVTHLPTGLSVRSNIAWRHESRGPLHRMMKQAEAHLAAMVAEQGRDPSYDGERRELVRSYDLTPPLKFPPLVRDIAGRTPRIILEELLKCGDFPDNLWIVEPLDRANVNAKYK